MSRTCRLRPGRVLARAVSYFGAGGLDLDRTASGPTEVEFEGEGGFVAVTAFPDRSDPPMSRVVVAADGWESHAHEFISGIVQDQATT